MIHYADAAVLALTSSVSANFRFKDTACHDLNDP